MQSNGIEVKGNGRLQALREMTFPLALRGYSRSEVDRFLGETAEWERCSEFLRDSSPTAYAELLG